MRAPPRFVPVESTSLGPVTMDNMPCSLGNAGRTSTLVSCISRLVRARASADSLRCSRQGATVAAMIRVTVGLAGWALAAVLVGSFAGGSTAHAQTPGALEADDAEARTVYQAGVQAYESGRYDRALDYFRRAYELSHRPQLLYNIGQTADRLRRDQEALQAFEQFLAEVGDSPLRTQVETRVAFLRETLARTAAASQQAVSEPTPADPPTAIEPAASTTAVDPHATSVSGGDRGEGGGGDVTGAWALLIAGGVVAIGGAVMLGVAAAENDAVQGAPVGSDWGAYEGRLATANGLSVGGGVALGVGVVAATLGVVWMATSGGGAREQETRVGLGAGTLVVEGSF